VSRRTVATRAGNRWNDALLDQALLKLPWVTISEGNSDVIWLSPLYAVAEPHNLGRL
jgi:hypothetical protein